MTEILVGGCICIKVEWHFPECSNGRVFKAKQRGTLAKFSFYCIILKEILASQIQIRTSRALHSCRQIATLHKTEHILVPTGIRCTDAPPAHAVSTQTMR